MRLSAASFVAKSSCVSRRWRVSKSRSVRSAPAGLPAQREAPAAEHLLRLGAGHNHAAFAVEQQDPLRQAPDDLLQLIADRIYLSAVAGEAAPQFAQTLRDGLHLDVHRARLGDLRAFDLELLDALHGFAQRPENHVRRNPRGQQAEADDDQGEDAAQFYRRPQVFAELGGGDPGHQLGERLVLEAERVLYLIDLIVAPQVPQLAVPPRRFETLFPRHRFDPAVGLLVGLRQILRVRVGDHRAVEREQGHIGEAFRVAHARFDQRTQVGVEADGVLRRLERAAENGLLYCVVNGNFERLEFIKLGRDLDAQQARKVKAEQGARRYQDQRYDDS